MKIVKITSNDCGGFQAPKGHLDTQMFPECAGKETDRNIVTKTIKRRNKGKRKACNDGNCDICKMAKLDPPPSGKLDTQLLERGGRRKKNGITYFTFNLKEYLISKEVNKLLK